MSYEVPINFSLAESFTAPQNQSSSSIVNFGSYDNARGGFVDWRDDSRVDMATSPATTASTTTAGRDATANTGSGSQGKGNALLIAAAVVVGAMIMKGRI